MLSTSSLVLLACASLALALYLLGLWAAFRHSRPRRARATDTALPAVSLLKPIKGDEEALEENLRTFFAQRYPGAWEMVFAATSADDPGLRTAERVAREYPHVRARFLVSDQSFGLNPKVVNLECALQAARYDLVLQTDANVRARPDFVRDLVSDFERQRASMLGAVVVGVGERSMGAALDNLQLTAFTSPAICLANQLAGIACVVGKAMLFRRSELHELGGLAQVKDLLAEDFVLGEIFRKAGRRVVLSAITVENVNIRGSIERFLQRHSRWMKMRITVSVPGFVADLCANPTVFALAAWVTSGFHPAVLGLTLLLIVLKTECDARLVERLRGTPMAFGHRWLSPLRDVLLAAIWAYALFSRTTSWRGTRFRLLRGSQLLPLDPDPPAPTPQPAPARKG